MAVVRRPMDRGIDHGGGHDLSYQTVVQEPEIIVTPHLANHLLRQSCAPPQQRRHLRCQSCASGSHVPKSTLRSGSHFSSYVTPYLGESGARVRREYTPLRFSLFLVSGALSVELPHTTWGVRNNLIISPPSSVR
jgi:hypothetical protein